MAAHAQQNSFLPPEELPERIDPPDPLRMEDGTPVEGPEDWPARRAEILQLFEHYIYGSSPEVPSFDQLEVRTLFEKEAFGGKGRFIEVEILYPPQGAPPLYLLLAIPESDEPVSAFLGLNFAANHSTILDPDVRLSTGWMPKRYEGVVDNRATEKSRGVTEKRWPFELAIERGYAMATLYHGDIDPDFADFSNGIHPLFYEPGQSEPKPSEWGAIAAWAWSLRVAATYLAGQKEINPDKLCLMGHSRNGKTALWAGAQDERFALVVSNQSGCGGAALSRRREGEKLVNINTNFPHWFNDHFPAFNDRETYLPVDQHQLLALIAPRPVLVCSAQEDKWADPPGEFASCLGADPVYRLLGTSGLEATEMPGANQLVNSRIGYHIRLGKHDVSDQDWNVFFDFADAQLRD